MKRGTRNLLSKQKLYFVSQIICVLPYVISKYISVPPLIFPYHNERYLWNKDNCTNLDKSMKRRMTFAFEVLCWCTLFPPPAQKSRHQKPRKSHESDQRAQIGRPCIPDLFSLNSFNQNCYFFLSTQPSLSVFSLNSTFFIAFLFQLTLFPGSKLHPRTQKMSCFANRIARKNEPNI